MRAYFERLEWENNARTIASFYFRPEKHYRYEAGQYAVIRLPHKCPDERGDSRTMTLSSSPHEELLKITMKVYVDGSSYKKALLGLVQGEEINISDAMGDLVLPINPGTPLIFVAGGIGIASFVGMAAWLTHLRAKREIKLFYTVADPADIVLQAPFDEYASLYNLTKTLYTPSVNTPVTFSGNVRHGRLSAADILPWVTDESLLYLSGGENFVEDLRLQIHNSGVGRHQVIFDYFDGYADL